MVGILQGHREVPFRRGIVLILDLYADGISRSIGFVIEGCGRAEGTVGIEGKGVVPSPAPLTR